MSSRERTLLEPVVHRDAAEAGLARRLDGLEAVADMVDEPESLEPSSQIDPALVDADPALDDFADLEVAKPDEHVPPRQRDPQTRAILRVAAAAPRVDNCIEAAESDQRFPRLGRELLGRQGVEGRVPLLAQLGAGGGILRGAPEMQEQRIPRQYPREAAGMEEREHLLQRGARQPRRPADPTQVGREVELAEAGRHELEIEVEAVFAAARPGRRPYLPLGELDQRLERPPPKRCDAEVQGAGVPAVYPRLALQGLLRGFLEVIGDGARQGIEGIHAVPGAALEGIGERRSRTAARPADPGSPSRSR